MVEEQNAFDPFPRRSAQRACPRAELRPRVLLGAAMNHQLRRWKISGGWRWSIARNTAVPGCRTRRGQRPQGITHRHLSGRSRGFHADHLGAGTLCATPVKSTMLTFAQPLASRSTRDTASHPPRGRLRDEQCHARQESLHTHYGPLVARTEVERPFRGTLASPMLVIHSELEDRSDEQERRHRDRRESSSAGRSSRSTAYRSKVGPRIALVWP
ncbi:hypothetical protein L1887_48375 [Cichorium endivia]|nr:hypothetical protein L1887_48375 [Cichorium endivia]